MEKDLRATINKIYTLCDVKVSEKDIPYDDFNKSIEGLDLEEKKKFWRERTKLTGEKRFAHKILEIIETMQVEDLAED